MSDSATDRDWQGVLEQHRRRQFRITARLLKEYTSRLYRIANHLGEYADGRVPGAPNDTTPQSVCIAANRFDAIKEEVRSAALFASQMLVHYDLDEASAAELRLRLSDVEHAVSQTAILTAYVFPNEPGKLRTNQSLPELRTRA